MTANDPKELPISQLQQRYIKVSICNSKVTQLKLCMEKIPLQYYNDHYNQENSPLAGMSHSALNIWCTKGIESYTLEGPPQAIHNYYYGK